MSKENMERLKREGEEERRMMNEKMGIIVERIEEVKVADIIQVEKIEAIASIEPQKKEMSLVEKVEARIEARRDTIDEMLAPLTIKQRRFVLEYVKHGNGRRAAEDAGYGNESTEINTLESIASENLRKPQISRVLKEILKPMTSDTFVLSRFYDLAAQAKSQDTQLRAVTELAKINGMYANSESPKTVNVVNITLPQPKEMKKPQVIDVDYGST